MKHRRRGLLHEDSQESNALDQLVNENLNSVDSSALLDAHPLSSTSKLSFVKSSKVVFLIGALLGILGASYLAQRNAPEGIADASFEWLMSHKKLIPGTLISDIQNGLKAQPLSGSFALGLNMSAKGYTSRHPIVIIPGVISTGLESWSLHGTEDCPSRRHYRKRLWGSWYMIMTMILEKNCWLQHMMLDPETGLDPPNFKLRPCAGVEAADFFMTGYWIWNKIIENLSAVGYDPNNLILASYDWRLGYADLERRDGFYSKLKLQIEEMKSRLGEKTVLVSHSMGSQVALYFMKWVEAEGYGNGGPHWVENNIEASIEIAGSMLGTPKATVALLSGEMRDTVQLNSVSIQGLEKVFGRSERASMLRTFPGIASMLPKGGAAIWGDMQGAPDDNEKKENYDTFGNFIRFLEPKSNYSSRNLTVEDSFEYLYNVTPSWFVNRTKSMYSFGLARTRKELKDNNNNPAKWTNQLEIALPNAPSMKYYCFYGIGRDTERGYYYKDATNDNTTNLNVVIDYEHKRPVILGEGDGTVSLVAHTMAHRWKDKNSKFNPGGIKIKVVEMLDEPDKFDLRRGSQTSEHVDILGRTELHELIIRIAAGKGDEIEERVISNVNDWVWKIDLGE